VVVINAGTSAAQGEGHDVLLGSALVFGAVCREASYSLPEPGSVKVPLTGHCLVNLSLTPRLSI